MKKKLLRSRSNSNELCDICGDVGFDKVLATCIICNTAREHVYCMRVYSNDNTKNWTCESCLSSNIVLPEACLKKGMMSTMTLDSSEIGYRDGMHTAGPSSGGQAYSERQKPAETGEVKFIIAKEQAPQTLKKLKDPNSPAKVVETSKTNVERAANKASCAPSISKKCLPIVNTENVVGSFSACKRMGEQEAEDLRRANIKYAVSKQKKLDTGAFECHFEKLWGSFSEDKRTSFTYLDCLWFNLYGRQPYKAKVLTWIKKKHLFSKNYVLVPIVCWGHWSLLIFCHFGESLQSKTRTPCMLLLDSLQMANPRRVEPDIRKFVLDIYKAEGRLENEDFIYRIPLLVPKVPQQTDDEECGSFVLYFSKLFVEGAPEDFRVEDYPYFMNENWFTREGLESFCEKLGILNGLPLKARRTSGRLAILKRKT